MRHPGFHRRVALVVFVAVTVGVVGSAGAAPEFPPLGNPNVTLNVTPNDGDGLVSPAQITVIGAGFGAGVSGNIYECSFNPTASFDECTGSLARFTSNSNGAFTQAVQVTRTAAATDILGQPVLIDCDVRPCTVQAVSDNGMYFSQHHITFVPATTTSTSTSTTTSTSTSSTSTTSTSTSSTSTSSTSTTSTTVPGPTTTTSTTTTSVPPGAERCFGRPATFVGTSGDDRLFGTAGPDVIVGLGGNDLIQAVDGDDVVCGGSGNDTIYVGAGKDMVHGGTGNDRIVGASGADDLRGAGGDDDLDGGGGNDQLDGGPGTDVCDGGSGTNTFANC